MTAIRALIDRAKTWRGPPGIEGPAAGATNGRLRLVVAAGVAVVISALGIWSQNGALVGINYDDGIYALLSRSLARGEGYRFHHLPVSLPGIKYPPVYPFSLVPFWWFAGSQEAALTAMKAANGVYLGIAAGLFVLLFSSLGLPLYLVGFIGLLGFGAASMMLVTSGLLSESLYLVALFAALLATDVWRGGRDRPSPGRLLVVGLLVAAVMLTRSAGVALLAAMVLAVWRRYGFKAVAVAGAGTMVAVLPWALFVAAGSGTVPDVLIPRYGSYLQLYLANLSGSAGNALGIIATNVGAILQTLGGKVVPQLEALGASVVGGVLLVIAALGSRVLWHRAPATAAYPWIYLAVVSFWSFPPFRFVFVLFPVLLILACAGVGEAVGNGRRSGAAEPPDLFPGAARVRPGWRMGTLALLAAVLANMAYREMRAVAVRVWDGSALERSAASAEVVRWAMEDAPAPGAVIAYELEPLLALYTGRTTVPNNYEAVHPWYQSEPGEPAWVRRLLLELDVHYVAVGRGNRIVGAPLDALLKAYPGGLEPVHIGRRALVLRVHRGMLAGPGQGD